MLTKNIQERYLELDSLRGIAAVMVVFFHFTMSRPEAETGLKLGTTGVDLFFIISGFVIFMSLSKVKTSAEFIVNRVSRLYPTYWAAVTFTFVLKIIFAFNKFGAYLVIRYLVNLTMFQLYFNIINLDGCYWTMIIEMLFYIFMIVIFQFKWTRFLEPIGLVITLGVVIANVFFSSNVILGKVFRLIPLFPFTPLFLAGIVFYKIRATKTRLLSRYATLLICLIGQSLMFNYGQSHKYISNVEYFLMLTLYFTVFTLFVHNKLGFLVSKPTLFFGKISFALYLIHQYISTKLLIPFLADDLHLNFWVAAVGITFPITVFVAYMITEYIEAPGGKKMKAKLRLLLTSGPGNVPRTAT